jgi:prefoldin subunit 5
MNRKNTNNGTAKKATKKAAKKTYTKKKTPPKPRRITLDDLAANHVKTEAAIQKLSAEIRGLSAENRKISVAVADAETRIAKSHEKTDKALQALTANVDRLSSNIGSLGKDIGELMEFIIIPKIRLAMNASGKHSFNIIQTDRTFRKIDDLGEKKALTEVDILLFSDTEAMAVETKTNPAIRDVKKHKERLEILRQHEEMIGIKGKTLFGAIVGAVIDKDVKNFALENGLYFVKIREEEEKLEVLEPETCKTW